MSSDSNAPNAEIMGMNSHTYCMLLHLSQLLNCIIPFAGIVVPIVLWAINKDKSTEVDQHGKIVLNWLISSFIYGIVSVLLCLIIIGVFIVPILLVLMIVFPIIGALKANDGIVWKYPLSIPFFK